MRTRQGTHVSITHGVDALGWVDCTLVFVQAVDTETDRTTTNRREVHVSDLRSDNQADEQTLRDLFKKIAEMVQQ